MSPQHDSFGDRLRSLRIDRGYKTARGAAEAFGWPPDSYTQHENGIRVPRRDTAARYARAFRCSLAWLLTGIGDDHREDLSPMIRVAGTIGAGQEIRPDGEFSDQTPAEVISEEAEAFEVKGDSMLPVARDGDMIFCAMPRSPRSLLNMECAVELADGRRFFKILRPGSKPGRYSLQSYNPTAALIENVEVLRAGHLIAVRRR